LTETALERVFGVIRGPLHPAWVVAVVAAASALLITAVGLKVAELVETSRYVIGSPPDARDRLEIDGRTKRTDGGIRIDVEGPPGIVVLLLRDGRPLGVVSLDEDGKASFEDFDPRAGEGPVQLIPLSSEIVDLELPRMPEPSPTKTSSPTATPTATETPTVTATSTPTATATATASATATARPSTTATPTRQRRVGSRPVDPRTVPTPLVAPPVLQLIQDAGPRIAITFDGNESSNRTAELLDLLQQHDLEVTIFATGRFIERYPAIIRRAVLSGHEFGNHTFSHPHLTTYAENRRHRLLPGVTRSSFQRELRRTEEAFRKATGHSMRPLWRAPFGEENRELRGWALEVGYLHVRWSSLEGRSLDSHDWVADEHSSLYKSSRRIMERLLQFPKLEGGIILMHMATEREEPPWQELPVFLEALARRGVEPTNVTELLEASPTWSKWLRRAEERHRAVDGS
jgi:peptidoglycan/xylan/chitin deacetylase (PgdA/CDA1 family)